MTKALALHRPAANLALTLRYLPDHQSQQPELLQAPPLEVDERQQPDIGICGGRDLGLVP